MSVLKKCFIFLGLLLGLPLPLLAVHILWINLVTDGLPALALGVDPLQQGLMKQKPRNPRLPLVGNHDMIRLLLPALLITAGTLTLFGIYLHNTSLVYAQTIAFTTLVFFELANVINYHVWDDSLFSKEILRNKWLFVAIGGSILLQVLVIYGLTDLFKVVALTFTDWVFVLMMSVTVIVFYEVWNRLRKVVHT